MSRPKGFKLSQEQKTKMQAGRKLAKSKIIIEPKKVSRENVFGWAIEGHMIVPVFNAEKDSYKGKIYKNIEKAAKVRDYKEEIK